MTANDRRWDDIRVEFSGGVLIARGDAPVELRQELRLAPEIRDALLGRGIAALELFHDPAAVDLSTCPPPRILPGRVTGQANWKGTHDPAHKRVGRGRVLQFNDDLLVAGQRAGSKIEAITGPSRAE